MNPWANVEVLHHRGNYLVRRQRLAPGEATPWHRDPFHRVTVVLSGDLLNIEFRDGGKTQPWKITAGEVDWSEPSDRVHRFQVGAVDIVTLLRLRLARLA